MLKLSWKGNECETLVHGEYKGIPKQQVREKLAMNTDVLLRLDVQGVGRGRGVMGQGQATAMYFSIVSCASSGFQHNVSDISCQRHVNNLSLPTISSLAICAPLHMQAK